MTVINKDTVVVGGEITTKVDPLQRDYDRWAVAYEIKTSGAVRQLMRIDGARLTGLTRHGSTWWASGMTGYDAKQRGILLKSTDDGGVWERLPTPEDSTRGLVVLDGVVYVDFISSIGSSSDGGKTWTFHPDTNDRFGVRGLASDRGRVYAFNRDLWQLAADSAPVQVLSPPAGGRIRAVGSGLVVIKGPNAEYSIATLDGAEASISNEHLPLDREASPFAISGNGSRIEVLALTGSPLPSYILLLRSIDGGKSWNTYRIDSKAWIDYAALGADGGGVAVGYKGEVFMP